MPEERTLGPRRLSQATGVSTDTLRHYERKGLLPLVPRTSAGYRKYPPGTVSRVLLIQRALVVGFTLEELRKVLGDRDKGRAPCRSVKAILDQRLGDLDRRLTDLAALRKDLRALAAEWEARLAGTPPGQRAYLLDSLAGRRGIESARLKRREVKRSLR